MSGAAAGDHYVVISADCHGGASIEMYREYLDPEYREEFDVWQSTFDTPWDDLRRVFSDDYARNFDSAHRQPALEGEGVVGEVLFPNTIPPFFSTISFLQGAPSDAESLRLGWAGFRAHNRWLADFCDELPGRRAGVAQIWLNDVDEAVAEVKRVKASGLFGGILLPLPAPGSGRPPLYAPDYEPLWNVCEDLEVPVNVHGGSGVPTDGFPYPAYGVIKFAENGWFTTRALPELILAGVFERHPRLHFAITETGSNQWIGQTMRNLDWLADRVERVPHSRQAMQAAVPLKELSLKPSEYWQRNCWIGASFMNRGDCDNRADQGVDKIMWGSDFPHYEGTFPFSRASLRWTFQGVDPTEVQQMVGGNAAAMYGFDLDRLAEPARRCGPTVEDLAGPMDVAEIPAEATSEGLAAVPRPAGRFC